MPHIMEQCMLNAYTSSTQVVFDIEMDHRQLIQQHHDPLFDRVDTTTFTPMVPLWTSAYTRASTPDCGSQYSQWKRPSSQGAVERGIKGGCRGPRGPHAFAQGGKEAVHSNRALHKLVTEAALYFYLNSFLFFSLVLSLSL